MQQFDSHNVPFSAHLLETAYMRHLEEVDAANIVRHHNGEQLMPYPSFDEFVAECREAAFELNDETPRFDAVVGSRRFLEPEYDEMPLEMMLPLPKLLAWEDENAVVLSEPTNVWVTEHGIFVFDSEIKH
jgi:hypothetical protein